MGGEPLIRFILSLVALLWIYLLYGVYYSHFELAVLPAEISRKAPEGFYDYRGVINVHSKASTGSGTIKEIVQAANHVGLDFLFINDSSLELNRPHPSSGYHDNVLVFVDSEYPYLGARILNLGASQTRKFSGPGHVQFYLTEQMSHAPQDHSDAGLFVWAHPTRSADPWASGIPPYLHGMEVINLKSLWQERFQQSKAMFFWSLFLFPFNDQLALTRLLKAPTDVVRFWDQLNQQRLLFGYAGSDATAKILLNDQWSIPYPSYETLFSLVSNHAILTSELTGDPQKDQERIMAALASGQFYISLDMLGNPKGFNFLATDLDKNNYLMGSTLPLKKDLRLAVDLGVRPSIPFEVLLFKGAQALTRSEEPKLSYEVSEPGIYRVEVRVKVAFPFPEGSKWLPWIYSNPIQIRKP